MDGYKELLASAAASIVIIALAGCQTEPPQSTEYKFELVGPPAVVDHRTTMSVRLVHADESPVVGAKVYVETWVYTGPKNAPNHVERIELHSDGQGNFVYSSTDLHDGDTIRLTALLERDTAPIRGSVTLP